KSRGNIVRAEPIQKVMGVDALRYFLLREIVFGQDGSFSYDALVNRYNADLANGLGNLASPTLTMIQQYRKGAVPPGREGELSVSANETIQTVKDCYESFEFSRAIIAVYALISMADQFIVQRAPWKLAKQDDSESQPILDDTLYTAAEALRITTALLAPVLPESAEKIWSQLGMDHPVEKVRIDSLAWGQLRPGQKIGTVAPVFPRIEFKAAVERMKALELEASAQQNALLGKKPEEAKPAEAGPAKITIDDF